MTCLIRSFLAKDREPLVDICHRTVCFDQADVATILELVNIYLNIPNQKDYDCIASVDTQDRLSGFICYGPTPLTQGTFDLYWIVVDPDCSHQGIGQALLAYFEHKVMDLGARLIIIETSSNPAYHAAQSFYQKHGYGLPEVIKNFYKPGEDRLTFVKEF